MSRRKETLFNLSFLDLLTSALGAVIFLFIITPKGGAPAAKTEQMVVYIDTVNQKIFGELPDSLFHKDIGDTLFTVLMDYRQFPKEEPAPEPVVIYREKEAPERPVKISKREEPVRKETRKPEPVKEEKKPVAKSDPKPDKEPVVQTPHTYKGDAPSVPAKVSFEINWQDDQDNVDLFVCRGSSCVYGGRKNDRMIGQWDSGKSRNRLFGNDLRTNQEAVRQFDRIIPGEYSLYAQFKESNKNTKRVTIKGLIYTKGKSGQERGETFSRSLPLGDDRVLIGRVKVEEDGSFKFIKK